MHSVRQSIHGQWSGRFTFIFAATGAAVGLGNIWKFPYIMGENGGGAFVLVYLAAILLLGIPVLMSEVLMGKRGRQSPGLTARTLVIEADAHRFWQITGWIGLLAGFIILSFYSVIAGWAFAYAGKAITMGFSGQDAAHFSQLFTEFSSDLTNLLAWTTVVIITTCTVVARGLKHGLEQVVRLMMPALFLLLIGLALFAGVNGDFASAVHFMFYPDFSKLTMNGVLIALGHAFFTLSLASGVMMIYGAYLPNNVSIVKTSFWIALADTSVAMLAGLIIYPIVFAQGLDAGQGPGLIFVTLPIAFANIPFGEVVGLLFFVMLMFAAFTSTIAMIESVVAWLMESRGFKRLQASVLAGIVLWLLSLLTVFSFAGSGWAQVNFTFLGKEVHNLFEVLDHLAADILLPLGGVLIALFTGWVMKEHATREELNTSALTYTIWRFCIRWVTPVAIAVVFFQLIGVL